MAVLKIDHIRKGHEGTYKCVTVNQDDRVQYNTVEVRVLNNGKLLVCLANIVHPPLSGPHWTSKSVWFR